jgi:hypothetical protein
VRHNLFVKEARGMSQQIRALAGASGMVSP